MNSVFVLFLVFASVMVLQSSPHAIETYDIVSIGGGAVMYYLFNLMKLMYLKKSLNMDEVVMTTIVVFMVGVAQKIINALVYPGADANNDGMVTRKEFEDWKRST
jgi:hypothetical protein